MYFTNIRVNNLHLAYHFYNNVISVEEWEFQPPPIHMLRFLKYEIMDENHKIQFFDKEKILSLNEIININIMNDLFTKHL